VCEEAAGGRRAGGSGSGEAGVHNQKLEPHTKMWGKRNEHHPWWNGGIPIAMFDY